MGTTDALEDFIIGRKVPEGTDRDVPGSHLLGSGAFDLMGEERSRVDHLLTCFRGEEDMNLVMAAYGRG